MRKNSAPKLGANQKVYPAAQQIAERAAVLATMEDNRPEAAIQRKLQAQTVSPVQRQENKTGLPDNLKSGIENLSGLAMDDVRVHRNSDKPAQLNAHAYAQGTDIHLAPGQEQHLPHEAWHVVQQKQGRVQPTRQMKGKVAINDDAGLEREADVMGEKALRGESSEPTQLKQAKAGSTAQLKPDPKVRSDKKHDARMAGLKVRTDAILTGLDDKDIHQKEDLGKKGKEKARGAVEGLWKKEDEQSKVKILFEEIWKRLTFEQKFYLVKEVAKGTGAAIWEAFKAKVSASGEKSGEKERQPASRESSPVGLTDFASLAYHGVSKLTVDDMKNLYEAMKQYREIQQQVKEVQNEVLGTAETVGQRVGEFFGGMFDKSAVKSLAKGQVPDWAGARAEYGVLREEILRNKDAARYGFLMEIFEKTYREFTDLFIVMISASPTDDQVKEALKLAKYFKGELAKAKIVKEGLFIQREGKDEVLFKAREKLAANVKRVLKEDWGIVGKAGYFTPKRIGKMQGVSHSLGSTEYLAALKGFAVAAGEKTDNRDPITHAFYAALVRVDTEKTKSLNEALNSILTAEANLKKKKAAKGKATEEVIAEGQGLARLIK